ncbi:hypothetical protein [Cetobacterium sp.]|uniref:hypothetical protein n=1 Tax=Cetobacterium sp. TaxID=2071632 RepID=UPI0025BCA563|nr:hypothetical protein [Cetobacterium sp.]
MNYILEHKDILFLVLGVILEIVLPKAKINLLGRKVGEKIPKKIAVMIANQIDSFEKGLRQQDVNGNVSLITNDQLSKETESLKINLGLELYLKERTFK